MTKSEEVLIALNELLQMDDVLACMLAKRGLEGLIPQGIKIKNINLWKTINQTTTTLFGLIDRFYDFGMGRLYFELGEYNIIMIPISQQFALLVIIPALANQGLLDVEIENTRRKIKEIVESKT